MRTRRTSSRAQLRGKKAQSDGAQFENLFHSLCHRENIAITRIPDGCKQITSHRMIRVKSPFDWILSCKAGDQTRIALIDTKAWDEKVLCHSQIKEHQVRELAKHESSQIRAGYVVWLKEAQEILFISATYMTRCIRTRGSIKRTEANTDSVFLLGSSPFDLKLRERLFMI